MSDPIHILGFSGSLRKDSHNSALLRAAIRLLPAGASLEIFDIGPIPLFNQDLESPLPAAVQEFKARLAAADAILIATPEYNHSIPGVLKNALDWASRAPRPLNHKPGAILSASTGRFGGLRAQQHLRQVLLHENVLLLNRPEVFVGEVASKFDPQGHLVDAATTGQLTELLAALTAWTALLRGR